MKKLGIVLVLLTLITACGQSPQRSGITVTHKLGETTLETNPEKVAVFDMGTLDTMTTLGLTVGALPKASVPAQLQEYAGDDVSDVGTLFEPDFEALAVYAPDLIIISGRASKHYDELQKIAPTIFIGTGTSEDGLIASMTQNIATLNTIYPDHDFTTAMDALNQKVARLRDAAQSSGLPTMFLLANGDEVTSFGKGSRYDHVFNEFGFIPVDHELDVANHGAIVSFELINSLAPEIMIVMDRAAVAGGDALAKDLLANDLVEGTPAYTNNRMIYVNPDTWYLTEGGLSAVSSMVDELWVIFE